MNNARPASDAPSSVGPETIRPAHTSPQESLAGQHAYRLTYRRPEHRRLGVPVDSPLGYFHLRDRAVEQAQQHASSLTGSTQTFSFPISYLTEEGERLWGQMVPRCESGAVNTEQDALDARLDDMIVTYAITEITIL